MFTEANAPGLKNWKGKGNEQVTELVYICRNTQLFSILPEVAGLQGSDQHHLKLLEL